MSFLCSTISQLILALLKILHLNDFFILTKKLFKAQPQHFLLQRLYFRFFQDSLLNDSLLSYPFRYLIRSFVKINTTPIQLVTL